MASLFKTILLSAIALAALVMVEQWFGITVAFVGAGLCFLAYIFVITLRQVREDPDDE